MKKISNLFLLKIIFIFIWFALNPIASHANILSDTNNISAANADSIIAAIELKLDKSGYGFFNMVCKDGFTLNYRLLIPNKVPNVKYPLVFTLPGSGTEGTNNTSQMGGVGASIWGQPEYQVIHPHYSVAPQPSALIPDSNWKNTYAFEYKELLDTLLKMYPDIDSSRVYITGFSAGASMTYRMLAFFPESIAAGVPVDGAIGGAHEGYDSMAYWPPRYVSTIMPLWMFNGGASDAVKPDQINGMFHIADSITAHGGDPITSYYPNLNHSEMEGMYKLHTGLFDWLFSQKKAEPAGVKYNENRHTISIYPNPTNDFIEIIQDYDFTSIPKIEIYSIIGVKVIETDYKEIIDVSLLSQGLYFLKVNDIVLKFVKY